MESLLERMSIKKVTAEVASCQQKVQRLTLEAHSLIESFNRQYPRGRRPAYLAMNPDGSLTAIRWRRSAGSHPRFELWDSTGLSLRNDVDPGVWSDWCDYEKRRQDLNFALANALYDQQRALMWLKQRRQLFKIRKISEASIEPLPF